MNLLDMQAVLCTNCCLGRLCYMMCAGGCYILLCFYQRCGTLRLQGACQWSEAALKGLSIRSITLIAMQQPSLSPHTQYPSQTMQHQYSQHGSLIPASTLPDPAVDDTAAGDLLPVAVNRQYSATSASTLAGAVSPGAGPAAWQYTAANSSSSVSCSTVLEPCDIGVQFRCLGPAPTAASGAQGQIVSGQPPRMDIALDISDLLLRMSPDVLQLVLTVSAVQCLHSMNSRLCRSSVDNHHVEANHQASHCLISVLLSNMTDPACRSSPKSWHPC
jgi:hypothetical protein